MKLGVIRRILREDLEALEPTPKWIDALLEPLNQFIGTVSQALTNNLSFTDNFAAKKFQLEFTHATELSINPNTKNRVSGLVVAGVDSWGSDSTGALATLISRYGWVPKSNGNIGVTFHFYAFDTTGDTTSGNTSLSSLASASNVKPGMFITGSGIPTGTKVSSVSGSTVTMSANATATQTATRVIFSPASQTVTFYFLTE